MRRIAFSILASVLFSGHASADVIINGQSSFQGGVFADARVRSVYHATQSLSDFVILPDNLSLVAGPFSKTLEGASASAQASVSGTFNQIQPDLFNFHMSGSSSVSSVIGSSSAGETQASASFSYTADFYFTSTSPFQIEVSTLTDYVAGFVFNGGIFDDQFVLLPNGADTFVIVPKSFDPAQVYVVAFGSGLGTTISSNSGPSSFAKNEDITLRFLGIAPVPEASTWAMMLIGVTGLGFMAYRRKSVAALS